MTKIAFHVDKKKKICEFNLLGFPIPVFTTRIVVQRGWSASQPFALSATKPQSTYVRTIFFCSWSGGVSTIARAHSAFLDLSLPSFPKVLRYDYLHNSQLTRRPSPQSLHGHRLLVAQVGTIVTPSPRPMEQATMKRLRRESPADARILIPLTATLAKRKVVMPPRTQSGMDVKNAAICGVGGCGVFVMLVGRVCVGCSCFAQQTSIRQMRRRKGKGRGGVEAGVRMAGRDGRDGSIVRRRRGKGPEGWRGGI